MNTDNLFDFIKVLFTNSRDYENVKNATKSKHFFMIQRFMSIKYPVNASHFNILNLNTASAIDSWRMITKNYGKTPSWIYTKTKKIKEEKLKTLPDKEIIKYFLKKYEISENDFESFLKYKRNETIDFLNNLEKQMKTTNDKK